MDSVERVPGMRVIGQFTLARSRLPCVCCQEQLLPRLQATAALSLSPLCPSLRVQRELPFRLCSFSLSPFLSTRPFTIALEHHILPIRPQHAELLFSARRRSAIPLSSQAASLARVSELPPLPPPPHPICTGKSAAHYHPQLPPILTPQPSTTRYMTSTTRPSTTDCPRLAVQLTDTLGHRHRNLRQQCTRRPCSVASTTPI